MKIDNSNWKDSDWKEILTKLNNGKSWIYDDFQNHYASQNHFIKLFYIDKNNDLEEVDYYKEIKKGLWK